MLEITPENYELQKITLRQQYSFDLSWEESVRTFLLVGDGRIETGENLVELVREMHRDGIFFSEDVYLSGDDDDIWMCRINQVSALYLRDTQSE